MNRVVRFLVLALYLVNRVDGETFSIRISTESHVNVVDSRFISFTIDPKYLFTSSDDLTSKEFSCMAASLTPAYLRIAGPSTSHITFNNRSLTIDHLDANLPEPNKHKRHLNSEEIETLDEYDSEESHEDILSKLKRSSDRLLNRHKRDLETVSQEITRKLNEDEEDKKIVPKLKKSKIHALTKQKRIPEDNGKVKSLDDESHESILSKLKTKRHGLLSKLMKSNQDSEERPKRLRRLSKENHLEVSHKQWKRFAKWAKDTGFSLVFAVNNGQKTEAGMWDPNPALNMLTIADKDDVQDIYWQLGYECNNQTLEDYLNDLQTLRMMVDTFEARRWKAVGGDVSGCLEAGSKSDFKDYVTLSTDTMDAVLLNGNSSSHELARMSEDARLSLLRLLSASSTPLWLTETPQRLSEQARAADWLTSLGYSARNGFNVHFRELLQNELYEPTLSFYMALLYKNLVGSRVLDVTMESSQGQAALFAHCTSLRHKPVPGAVTLYAVNMDSEPARFSVKLAKREEGGDIMQFILGHDLSGNIVVNGRPMFYEGNIRPVVKRVRPYKTLLLNLPPKTFGFWVLANTKVNACYDYEDKDNATLVEAKPVNDTSVDSKEEKLDESKEAKKLKTTKDVIEEKAKISNKTDDGSDENSRRKRSLNLDDFAFDIDVSELNEIDNDKALRARIDRMNRGLREVQGLFANKDELSNRVRRQAFEEEWENRRKSRRQLLKKGEKKLKSEHTLLSSGIIEKLINNVHSIKIPKLNLTRTLKELKQQRKTGKSNISKLSKRNSRNYRNREDLNETSEDDSLSRKKRSVLGINNKNEDDKKAENEIDLDDKKHYKLRKFSKKHKFMQELMENDYDEDQKDEQKSSSDHDAIEINTKITDDDAEIKISENADHGLLKSAFENVLSLLEELNHNLSKLWTALSFLD